MTQDLPFRRDVEVVALLASPLHRYEGRPDDGPGGEPESVPADRLEIRAGMGVVGDRFFGRRAHVEDSVTLMAAESLDRVAALTGIPSVNPMLARRNIVLRGVDVDSLRGATVELAGAGGPPVRLRVHRPANPCRWMDVVYAPGAHAALRRRGGMRAEPISDGIVSLGSAVLSSSQPLTAVDAEVTGGTPPAS